MKINVFTHKMKSFSRKNLEFGHEACEDGINQQTIIQFGAILQAYVKIKILNLKTIIYILGVVVVVLI